MAVLRARSGLFDGRALARGGLWLVATVGGALLLTGCSGKTDRGHPGGDGASAQRPAAGVPELGAARSVPAKHLLMVVELEPAAHAARTLSARSVELPLPRRRGPKQRRPWRVDVLSANEQVLFSAPQDDTTAVRGEFADANGKLSGVTARKHVAAVTLRLPWLSGAAQVRLVDVSGGHDAELGRVAYPRMEP